MPDLPDSFSVAHAAALPGAPWLQQRRVSAAEAFREMPLPTAAEEEWRYSPVGELHLETYHPAPGAPVAGSNGGRDAGAAGTGVLAPTDSGAYELLGPLRGRLGSLSALVVTCDGQLVSTEIAPAAAAAGLAVRMLADEPVPSGGLGDVLAEPADAFGLMAEAFCPAPAARLQYLTLQELGPRTAGIDQTAAAVDSQGHLAIGVAAVGGAYARCRVDCTLSGRGATGDISAMYFADRDQVLDFRTFQNHVAPDTNSNLLFVGAVEDRARSIYTGLIRVGPDARGTDAQQTNRILKLSEGVWADSVPNLEIENNDVRCAHASSVGPIDEDHRFYLESRGVPPDVAERLIVEGFFREAQSRLPVQAVAAGFGELVRAKIGPDR